MTKPTKPTPMDKAPVAPRDPASPLTKFAKESKGTMFRFCVTCGNPAEAGKPCPVDGTVA